jgi:hypothetical protein
LNIESVTADGESIWFGLRAPVDKDGNTFLVRGNTTDLFLPGHAPTEAMPTVFPIRLDGLGIRDLDMLPDKRLLVLTGTAHGPEAPFKLFIVDTNNRTATPLGQLPEVKQSVDGKPEVGKAEALTILDTATDRMRILFFFDELVDGAPHLAEIPIPK